VKNDGWNGSGAPVESGWNDEAAQGAPGFADSGAAPPVDDGFGSGAAGADAAEPAEEEDTSISYADYLAAQAEKKMQGLGVKEARQPDQGGKQDGKLKAISRGESEQYMQGSGEKSKRERDRQRNAPQRVNLDLSWKASAPDTRGGSGRGGRGDRRGGDRGGRGEYRGRGDGDFRGRGDGEFRGRGDGDFRGRGRGRGDGEFRGRGGRGGRGRGGSDSQPVAVNDESAFPSLGA
jgi:plasminogen activator inhibitor 1 RNA-binding protein